MLKERVACQKAPRNRALRPEKAGSKKKKRYNTWPCSQRPRSSQITQVLCETRYLERHDNHQTEEKIDRHEGREEAFFLRSRARLSLLPSRCAQRAATPGMAKEHAQRNAGRRTRVLSHAVSARRRTRRRRTTRWAKRRSAKVTVARESSMRRARSKVETIMRLELPKERLYAWR